MLVEIFRSTASPVILNPMSIVLAVTLSTTVESSYAALISETSVAKSVAVTATSKSLMITVVPTVSVGLATVPTTPAFSPVLRRYNPGAIPRSVSAVPLSSRSTRSLASFRTSSFSVVTSSMSSVLICVPIAVKSVSVETIVSWFRIKLVVLLSPVTNGVTSSPRTYASA